MFDYELLRDGRELLDQQQLLNQLCLSKAATVRVDTAAAVTKVGHRRHVHGRLIPAAADVVNVIL
ncbi:hypothetical protein HK405_006459 [Cladochytrium tenue]|nr:hypothetical protein HK405_006459 [Cladochytrium tenue]